MSMTKVTSGIIDTVDASKITGTMPAIDGSALTNLPAGGTWVPLQEVIADNTSTSVSFTGPMFSSTYTNYVIVFNRVLPANQNVELLYEFYQNSAWTSASYRYSHWGYTVNGVEKTGYSTSNTKGRLISGTLASDAYAGIGGIIRCWCPTAVGYPSWRVESSLLPYSGYPMQSTGVIQAWNSGLVTNMRFSVSSGNMASGEFRLYGIKDS